jgi:organic radical activating enzyme
VAGLRVIEVFDSLQGEGLWTGTPMTFVRLAGCNASELGLGCVRWCDTPESWDPTAGETLSASAVLEQVRLPRLCLTGGEPLLQQEGVRDLLVEAHRRDIRVHLETNGTVAPPGPTGHRFVWVTVSPKPPTYSLAASWAGQVDELKLVADEFLDAATAERLAATHPEAALMIQPCYEPALLANGLAAGRPVPASATRAVALVMSHPEWRLSLQAHKVLGIR